jgi:hypothetical protein
VDLVGSECADFGADRAGWFDEGGDVAGDHAPTFGLPERAAQHGVGVLRGPRAQPFVLDRGEHRLDVLRHQFRQPDMADVRDHVAAQRAAVADDRRVAHGAWEGLGEPPLEVLADLLAVVAEAAALL